jgi:nitroimidazol reductase NimA-like FMN-containing flavoprotein (pyridoxamine 5'-phosphate oxidase superfamily)
VALGSDDVSPLIEIQDKSFTEARPSLTGSWPPSNAMDASALARFLSSKLYAVLATTRSDGRPHLAPVGFFVSAGALWFATVAGARLRNLERTPYASVVVMEGEGDDHLAVLAEGPVTLHSPASRLHDLWEERFGTRPDWAATFIEMRPERLFSHVAS